MKSLQLFTLCCLLPGVAGAQVSLSSMASDGIFYGGGIGASMGSDTSYIEVSPMIGKHFTDKISAGVGVSYRYTSDTRPSPDVSSHDFGANLFTRYRLLPNIFLEGAYEYINYEVNFSDGSDERRNFSSVLVGGGFTQPISESTSFYASALYNLSWDDEDSPYDDPWNLRFGVNVGF
ncbi:hypothetical protein Q4485_01350 [Granulosicoccaceae sp. 1_MG-2023]|nr:hypothetical protein [Granulosicoccaceae sp. 1_MG-2023]